MRRLLFSIKEAFRALSRSGLAGWLAIMAMASVAAFGMVFIGVHQSLDIARQGILERFELEAFVYPGRESKLSEIEDWARKREGVIEVKTVDKDKAAERFSKQYGGELFDLLSENPLPASVIITYDPEKLNLQWITTEADNIKSHKDIEDIYYEGELLSQVEQMSGKIGLVLIIIASVVAVIAIFLTFQSVRVAAKSSKDWARAVRLVGGTETQVRQPFVLTGVLIGSIGGIFGALIIYLAQYLLAGNSLVIKPEWLAIIAMVVITVLTGSFGALAAVPKNSSGKLSS